jgi:hypothetical protein
MITLFIKDVGYLDHYNKYICILRPSIREGIEFSSEPTFGELKNILNTILAFAGLKFYKGYQEKIKGKTKRFYCTNFQDRLVYFNNKTKNNK